MKVDTCADNTVISSKMWTKLGKSQLDEGIEQLEAYDGLHLTLLGPLTWDAKRNGSRYTQKQLVVEQAFKEFGLLGRDIITKHCDNNIRTKTLARCERVTKFM